MRNHLYTLIESLRSGALSRTIHLPSARINQRRNPKAAANPLVFMLDWDRRLRVPACARNCR